MDRSIMPGWMPVTVTYPIWTQDGKHFLARRLVIR